MDGEGRERNGENKTDLKILREELNEDFSFTLLCFYSFFKRKYAIILNELPVSYFLCNYRLALQICQREKISSLFQTRD